MKIENNNNYVASLNSSDKIQNADLKEAPGIQPTDVNDKVDKEVSLQSLQKSNIKEGDDKNNCISKLITAPFYMTRKGLDLICSLANRFVNFGKSKDTDVEEDKQTNTKITEKQVKTEKNLSLKDLEKDLSNIYDENIDNPKSLYREVGYFINGQKNNENLVQAFKNNPELCSALSKAEMSGGGAINNDIRNILNQIKEKKDVQQKNMDQVTNEKPSLHQLKMGIIDITHSNLNDKKNKIIDLYRDIANFVDEQIENGASIEDFAEVFKHNLPLCKKLNEVSINETGRHNLEKILNEPDIQKILYVDEK